MPSSGDIFAKNMAALSAVQPDFAQRLRNTAPAELVWTATPKGALSASVLHDGKLVQLASRFDPRAEAGKLIEVIDYSRHSCVVILGVGLGYHVCEVAKKTSSSTVVIVFEPDLPVLRAALEKMDHCDWLGKANVLFADAQTDRPGLIALTDKCSALLTQGTILVHHPPTRLRHGEAVKKFCDLLTDVTTYYRMHVSTALVNSGRTIANLTANLAYYIGGANTNELHKAASGYPAVCVSAGPSLARNVDLLKNPEVRKNVVVICAQTTLKPLLQRGIKPDFVTALDYHEISKRFYEGLDDLPDVTLIAEPKANPSVLDSFPGPIRCTNSGVLTQVLGPRAPAIAPIKQGSTVAHLSVYVAQHLGCDPIILIGQDLGFSDGLYYCPGTAIHEVWAPELNPFNTLEMFEWQRIVRHRHFLMKQKDVHGRDAYTDEQMVTYLQQFEKDFAAATQTILDATEGGLPKKHTVCITLAEALAKYATRPAPKLPVPATRLDPARLRVGENALGECLKQARELRQITQDTQPILRQMVDHWGDKARINKLFDRLERNRVRAHQLEPVFQIINDLNTVGTFRRARTDRAIEHSAKDPEDRQKKQITRDIENLNWLLQACDEAIRMFRVGLDRIQQRPEYSSKSAAAAARA